MLKKLEKIRLSLGNPGQIFILVAAVIIALASSLPYFNLFLNQQMVFLLFLLTLTWIFNFSFRFVYLVAISFIIFAIFLLLFSHPVPAEKVGIYIFLFLLAGFANMTINLIRNR